MVRLRLVGVGIAVAVAVVVFAAPASAATTISASARVVTNTIRNSFLVQPSSPPASSVSCPSQQVKAFQKFRCTAIVDGGHVPVAVQVLDTVPLTVNATPLKSVLSVNRSEGALEGRYFDRTGVAVSAVCPGGTKQFLVVNPGTTITCKLIGSGGQVATGTVTATDLKGGYASSVLPSSPPLGVSGTPD